MAMVLVFWCYIAAVSFLTGFAVLAPFQKKSAYRIRHVTSYLLAGLLTLNVYAQYFSLFSGVGLWAHVPVIVFDAAALAVQRRELLSFLKQKRRECGRGKLVLTVFLTVLLAYGSSRGYMHYDTGLYHAQSIRWIEEYGVVPGLANLHSRFGYNSAAFALCALFGGHGLTSHPMHCLPGFFALLCAVRCTALTHLFRRRSEKGRPVLRISDFLYVGCIFYLVAVFRELLSPASDYFTMLILFLVMMTWTELLEERVTEILPHALLAECLVYTATVKLSAAALLVMALYPGVLLIRKKRWGQIAGYLLLGLGIALPWLIRNVLISGWLFYPFTFLDIFPVDWKISKGYADSDAYEIQVYAKGIYDVLQKDQPFAQWFPAWFGSQTVLDRLLVLSGWLALPTGVLMMAAAAFRQLRTAADRRDMRTAAGRGTRIAADVGQQSGVMTGRFRTAGGTGAAVDRPFSEGEAVRPRTAEAGQYCLSTGGFLILESAAVVGFLFWQFGAPLTRYGYFYVLFLPMLTFGTLYLRFLPGNRGFYGFTAILVAFLLYRGYNLSQMVLEFSGGPFYFWQQDYGDWPASSYEVDGVTIYVPESLGQIGYDKFPSSPVLQDIELRGDTLESGFRKKSSAG